MKKNKKRLIIIDIGSHKLEELFILLNPKSRQFFVYIRWIIVSILKSLKKMNTSGLLSIEQYLKIFKYYFLKKRSYNIKIISVEPNIKVAYKYIKKMSKKYPVHYLPIAMLGHDAKKDAEIKTLFFYDKTISSSIYKRNRPMDNDKASICIGIKFDTIWNGLVDQGIINKNDTFLLRMNCEGSELGVIEDCKKNALKPICIIGSLGDVDKIHGSKMGDKTRNILKQMGTDFYYFKGDGPSTWLDMIDIWKKYADNFIIK